MSYRSAGWRGLLAGVLASVVVSGQLHSTLVVAQEAVRPESSFETSPQGIGAPGGGKQGNATPASVVKFSNGLLSISAKGIDVRTLIGQIAAESGVEIVLDKSIAGQVTADFKELGFEEALKRLLRDIVAGGVSSEFIKKSNASGEFDLRKVVIAPRSPETAKDLGRVLRIDNITVQDAIGKEVVFAKRGDGPGEIPLPEREIEGHVYRGGFRRLQVGEDGSIYLFGGSATHFFVYDATGNQRAILWPTGNYPYEDIDHEGNVYFTSDNEVSRMHSVNVLMLNPEGKEIAKVTVPPQDVELGRGLELDDAALRVRGIGTVYDFRKYLKSPNGHAKRGRFGLVLSASLPDELWVEGVRPLGLNADLVKAGYPKGWKPGRDGTDLLGVDQQKRIYVLTSLWKDTPLNFYDDYAIAVVDPQAGATDYFKINPNEMDTFVYEFGGRRQEANRFDMDAEGNVYHVFTTKEGTHVYQYELGGRK